MKYIYFVFSLLILSVLTSSAQSGEDVLRPRGMKLQTESRMIEETPSPWAFGIEAGINYNMYSQDITYDPIAIPNSVFNTIESGDGIAPFFGFFLDYSLDRTFGLIFKVQYDMKNFGATENAIIDCSEFDEITGEILGYKPLEVEVDWESEFAVINFELLFRANLTTEFFLTLGPSVQLPIADATVTTTSTIDENNDCYYYDEEGNGTKRIENVADMSYYARAGLNIGAGYMLHIAPNMYLIPQLNFQFMPTLLHGGETTIDASRENTLGITPFVTNENALLHSLRFSVALMFDI